MESDKCLELLNLEASFDSSNLYGGVGKFRGGGGGKYLSSAAFLLKLTAIISYLLLMGQPLEGSLPRWMAWAPASSNWSEPRSGTGRLSQEQPDRAAAPCRGAGKVLLWRWSCHPPVWHEWQRLSFPVESWKSGTTATDLPGVPVVPGIGAEE